MKARVRGAGCAASGKKRGLRWCIGLAALFAAALLLVWKPAAAAEHTAAAAVPAAEKHYRAPEHRAGLSHRAADTAPEPAEQPFFEETLSIRLDQKALGDEVVELLEDALGMDIGWLESVALRVTGGAEEGLMGGDVTAQLNDKDILDMTVAFDQEEGAVYLYIPTLSDKGMRMDVKEMLGEEMAAFDFERLLQELDGELVARLFERYGTILADNIELEDAGKETVEAGTLSAEYSEVEMRLDGEKLLKLGTELITAMRDDEDVKTVYRAFLLASGVEEKEADEQVKAFAEQMDEALKELGETKSEDVDLVIALRVYLDALNNFRGFRLQTQEGEQPQSDFGFVLVVSANRFGLKLNLDTATLVEGDDFRYADEKHIVLDGEGQVNLKKEISGEFVLSYRAESDDNGTKDSVDLDALTVTLDAALLDEGLRYRIDAVPTDALLALALEDAEGLPAPIEKLIRGLSLSLRGEVTAQQHELSTVILVDEKDCLSLSMAGRQIEPYPITKPAEAVDPDTWSETVSPTGASEIITRLREAGVPAALLDSLMS